MQDSVTYVKGVGEKMAKMLKKLGICTVNDLLTYYPRGYNDYSKLCKISELQPGMVCIKAVLETVSGRYVRRGMHVSEATVSDGTNSVKLVWFNQPYRLNGMKTGAEYFIVGDFGLHGQRMCISSPSTELVSDLPIGAARIVPIYKLTIGINSKTISKFVASALKAATIDETLPGWLVKTYGLFSLNRALQEIHFPTNMDTLTQARQRLGFEEIFCLTLASLINKSELKGMHSRSIMFDEALARQFTRHLPFKLTDAQRRVVWTIYQDMQKDQPMNRLVEGDVGSGKTVVAVMAAVMALSQGYSVALMAPTEILARQHAESVYALLEPLGMSSQLGLLIGATKQAQKTILKAQISKGLVRFIIGTHALIQSDVDMNNLGLVIIDEQHRFGVAQRKALQAKAGFLPHILSMTATPIPRSLALTVYGELDISLLDTLPLGRLPIQTSLVSPNSMAQLYSSVEEQITLGRQVFWVCPLISESTVLQAKAAEKEYEHLKKIVFSTRRLGLLHGKMKAEQKDKIMQQFVDGSLDIIICTTVIEVGVNVPNASVMVIEGAERFGLSQLHQLRGRVGRGQYQSYCYLVMSDSKAPSKRLRYLEQTTDGFKLAEYDLKLRGPGAIYGHSQHGQLDLRVADITDVKLIASARSAAAEFLKRSENLLQYNQLHDRVNRARSITNLN